MSLFKVVEVHVGEPEGMPDVHRGSAICDGKALNRRIVWGCRFEDGSEVMPVSCEVCVGGRIEEGEKERRDARESVYPLD